MFQLQSMEGRLHQSEDQVRALHEEIHQHVARFQVILHPHPTPVFWVHNSSFCNLWTSVATFATNNECIGIGETSRHHGKIIGPTISTAGWLSKREGCAHESNKCSKAGESDRIEAKCAEFWLAFVQHLVSTINVLSTTLVTMVASAIVFTQKWLSGVEQMLVSCVLDRKPGFTRAGTEPCKLFERYDCTSNQRAIFG